MLNPDDRRLRSLRCWLESTVQVRCIGMHDMASLVVGLSRPAQILRLAPKKIQLAQWNPRDSGTCPGCLDRRCRQQEAELDPAAGSASRDNLLPMTSYVVDILSYLSQRKIPIGSGLDVDLEALSWRQFWVEPDPSCPCCVLQSGKEKNHIAPVELHPRIKRSATAYRIIEVDQLALSPERYLNETCGFLGPAYTRSLFLPFGARVQGTFSINRRRVSWGANSSTYGRSLSTGLCEAFERHASHAVPPNQPTVVACLRDVRDRALDPRECGLYDSEFYEINTSVGRFSEDLRIRWIEGYSLTESRPILVPTQLAHYGAPLEGEQRFVFSNSNGSASGTCVEEAIFFAILEVIERDAFMTHWLACLSPKRVNLDSIENPTLHILRARLRHAGYELSVLDARFDIPVPTLVAVLNRSENTYGAFAVGACAHFNPEVAIVSSVSDAASRVAGFADRTRRAETRLRGLLADYGRVRTIGDHGALYGLPEAAHGAAFLTAGPMEDYEHLFDQWNTALPHSMDLKDDVNHLISILRHRGLQRVIVVDMSSPESLRAGLRTVKVLIPGALPIDFGHGKLRVSNLPRFVRLGAMYGKNGIPLNYRIPHPFA